MLKKEALTGSAVLAALWISLAVGGCSSQSDSPGARLDVPPRLAIAHGMGRVEGAAKTNSIDALEANYERGFRWFEVDLDTTGDGALVCIHPASVVSKIGVQESLTEISRDEFLLRRYGDRFRTQTFRQLVERLRDTPEMVIVTDSKELGAQTLARVAHDVDSVDPALRARIVLQMYKPEELPEILEVEARGGTFGGVIFTLYQIQISDSELLAFVEESGLRWITMPEGRFSRRLGEQLHGLGAKVFLHTLNDLEAVQSFLDEGADGVYTDDLTPAQLAGSPGRGFRDDLEP